MIYIKLFDSFSKKENDIFESRPLDIDFLSRIDIPDNSTILDISYGNGAESKYLSENGHFVYSTELTDKFSDRIGKAKHYTHDTKDPFPFKDNFFDLIISRLGLHYFNENELNKIFKELHRICKVGGELAFTVKIQKDDINSGKIFLPISTWKKIVENNGFKIRYIQKYTGYLYEVESTWIEIHSIKKED